jgi:hypothetical protein
MKRLLLASLLLIVPVAAHANKDAEDRSPRSGYEATVASKRQAGGYNNYCETWSVYRKRDQALFRACLD